MPPGEERSKADLEYLQDQAAGLMGYEQEPSTSTDTENIKIDYKQNKSYRPRKDLFTQEEANQEINRIMKEVT